jgi:F-type H+-transporting ATPase subunit b
VAAAGRTRAAEPAAVHPGEHETEHSESLAAIIARLLNFAVLAGALVYLLRSPFRAYLANRGVVIRQDLSRAARLRQEAAEQIRQVEQKLTALPDELAALRRRGAEEMAAEDARIQEAAAVERQRTLELARREIAAQLRVAERDLKRRAGELAVAAATERIKRTITDADQARLVDRYLEQVRQ